MLGESKTDKDMCLLETDRRGQVSMAKGDRYKNSIDPGEGDGGIADGRIRRQVAEGFVCSKHFPPRGRTAHDGSPLTGSWWVSSCWEV